MREQLAASLGTMPSGARESAVALLLQRHATDPVAMDAALSGIRGSEGVVLEKLLRVASGATPQLEAAATMIAATLIRSDREPAIQQVFADIGNDNHPEWQRSALMRGAEVALLGASMPGSEPRGVEARGAAPAAPCATCPGGRAGPGGAYAFPHAEPGSNAPYGGANGGEPAAFNPSAGGPGVRLGREPAALRAVAASATALSPRAERVLARLDWPGKPGAAPAAADLTPDQREAFNRGREVYGNICQACHQPDGRGQDRVAPSLVGSALALARPEIPTRILLHGKEGTIGLMPSIGSVPE